MRQTPQPAIRSFADPASLLAIVTAFVFIALYAILQRELLLVFCVGYALLGAVGIYWNQRGATAPDTRAQEPSLDTTLPPENLQVLTTRMSVTVDGLVRASKAINDVSVEQSSSAREQASVITQANERLDEFLEMSDHISDQARHVTQIAQQATDISETGQHAITQSIHTMEDIRGQVKAIGETIATLARLTRRIDTIITSVSEIATQSNLLALNASIEAARAGQHGRGFAVVADEVRTLAQQSTESASQVREILGEIQKAMKETVRAAQEGRDNADEGVTRTQEANAVMQQLTESVRTSREAMSDVYDVIRQQAEGMEDIVINMDRMQRLTENSLSNVSTVEAVSSNLNRLANDLKEAHDATLPPSQSTGTDAG